MDFEQLLISGSDNCLPIQQEYKVERELQYMKETLKMLRISAIVIFLAPVIVCFAIGGIGNNAPRALFLVVSFSWIGLMVAMFLRIRVEKLKIAAHMNAIPIQEIESPK